MPNMRKTIQTRMDMPKPRKNMQTRKMTGTQMNELERIIMKLNKQDQETIKKALWIDTLTGLKNRNAFEYEAPLEIRKAKEIQYPITFILIDIDNFKTLNDTKGHQYGDQILKEIGTTIEGTTKQYDTKYRYGGEEFCIILPNTDINTGIRIAERIRTAIYKRTEQTVSIGITETNENLERILKIADEALYQSKKTGKNKITKK